MKEADHMKEKRWAKRLAILDLCMLGLLLFLFAWKNFKVSKNEVMSIATAIENETKDRVMSTEEKKIAITFDAAWSAEDTDELIEILKNHNAAP